MPLPPILSGTTRLPVFGAPLFIISNPQLTIAQCKAGVIGAFPALNARPQSQLDEWLAEITETLADHDARNPMRRAAPFAVNQIVHKSNARLEQDLMLCIKYKVPVVISSLGTVPEVNAAIHSYGGIVLHDVINNRHANSAIRKGADGLIAVAAGAGGHAGTLSPFALVQEIRSWFDGPLLLSGAIATGGAIRNRPSGFTCSDTCAEIQAPRLDPASTSGPRAAAARARSSRRCTRASTSPTSLTSRRASRSV